MVYEPNQNHLYPKPVYFIKLVQFSLKPVQNQFIIKKTKFFYSLIELITKYDFLTILINKN
jgi:hypothetical protein